MGQSRKQSISAQFHELHSACSGCQRLAAVKIDAQGCKDRAWSPSSECGGLPALVLVVRLRPRLFRQSSALLGRWTAKIPLRQICRVYTFPARSNLSSCPLSCVQA